MASVSTLEAVLFLDLVSEGDSEGSVAAGRGAEVLEENGNTCLMR